MYFTEISIVTHTVCNLPKRDVQRSETGVAGVYGYIHGRRLLDARVIKFDTTVVQEARRDSVKCGRVRRPELG